MGQKINPISLRLQSTNRHFDNCWYSNYFYKNLITKDLLIQSYLNSFLKLVKLPTGRYSIQHLQKKTQISSFFCYSKSTREWRSKIFGLTKNRKSFKKSRYFFKATTKFKKKTKKQTQLSQFYNSLNQLGIYKIQKKITSFQNFHLWSKFFQIKNKNLNKLQSFYFVSSIHPILEAFVNSKNKISLIQKNNQLNLSNTFEKQDKLIESNFLLSEKQAFISSSSLLFLQNLLIYKTLKSQAKKIVTNQTLISNTNNKRNLFISSEKVNFKALELKYNNYLESHLSSFFKQQIDLIPFKVKNDWQHASYLAEEIVYFLEKRLPFRRLKSKLIKQLAKLDKIRGVRITCSGRVGGKSKKAQRSKVECLKYGQTSLHVFSSKIDYSQKTAFTSFGSVGVKVWICYK